MGTDTVLEMLDITKEYGQGAAKTTVLRGVSLAVASGEYLSIMGPSGSGKSTLLYIMGLLHRPSSGRFRLWDQDLEKVDRRQAAHLRNHHIGFVFQDSLLLGNLPVLDNVELPLYYAQVPRSRRRARALEMLEQLGLGHRAQHLAKTLSGGERQRVAIARALINRPRLVLADEPTGNLDSTNSDHIMAIFNRLHAQGITLVVITHDADVAANCQKKLVFMDGRIAA